VLKEICEPNGAIIHSDAFELGDPTINVLELWGAEYQVSVWRQLVGYSVVCCGN